MVANLSFLEMFVIIIPVPSQRFSVQFAHKTHFVSGAIYTTTPEARVNSKNCIFEVKILVMSRVAGSVGADYLWERQIFSYNLVRSFQKFAVFFFWILGQKTIRKPTNQGRLLGLEVFAKNLTSDTFNLRKYSCCLWNDTTPGIVG